MLKVLIVGLSGEGTSVMLKNKLEEMIPGNEYVTSSLAEMPEVYKGFDAVLTFEQLKPHIEEMLKHDKSINLKTVEGFNAHAKDLFNEYLGN